MNIRAVALPKTTLALVSILLAIAALSLSIFFSLTQAQTSVSSQSLEVSPPTQEVVADPGQTITLKAKVRNKSNAAVDVRVRVDNFTAAGDEGQVALQAKDPNTIAAWSAVTPDQFPLRAGEQREVTATVSVPRGAAGGHYASFVFGTVPPNANPNETALSQEVASLFLVRVNGPVNEKVEIVGFTAPRLAEFGPVPMTLTFNNTGNVHVRPTGLIAINDMFNRKVKDVVMEGKNVLPGSNRKVDVELDNRVLFGKYTANAVLVYGAGNESINATTTFYVFPYRLALIVLLIAGVLFTLRKRLGKSFKALGGK